MQIPPTTALLNLLASLPAQGASITAGAPAAAKSAPPAPPPVASAPAAAEQPAHSVMRRGSIINIVA